jgi:hypothetical protein
MAKRGASARNWIRYLPPVAAVFVAWIGFSHNCDAQIAGAPSAGEEELLALASTSHCRLGPWSDPDPAPRGYIKGLVLVYKKSFCEVKNNADAAAKIISGPVGSPLTDALSYYGKTGSTAIERLRMVYTLAMGVGMVESSGNTTDGVDEEKTIKATAENAEAGIFQTSYDSLNDNIWLGRIYQYYKAHPQECALSTFMEGVDDRNKPVIGSGAGAAFQKFTKDCPAFATEYALVMFRTGRQHYGTINARRAKFVDACYDMFRDMELLIDCDH